MEDSGIEQTEGLGRSNISALPEKDDLDSSELMFAKDEQRFDTHLDTIPPQDSLDHDNLVIRTLDGGIAGDEFAQDAINYQILLGKIDSLLDKLALDA
jgi:ankyrin repeat/BTB/POZ domain-containing protein 1